MQYEDIKEGLRVTYAKEPIITDYYVRPDARGQSGKIIGTPMDISSYQGTFIVPVKFDDGLYQHVPIEDLVLENDPIKNDPIDPSEWREFSSKEEISIGVRVMYKTSILKIIPSCSLGTICNISEVSSGFVLVEFDDKSIGLNGLWPCSIDNLKTSNPKNTRTNSSIVGRRFKLIKDEHSGVADHRIGTTGIFLTDGVEGHRARFDADQRELWVDPTDTILLD
jgi:hypothetical protein